MGMQVVTLEEFKPPENSDKPSVLQKLQKWGDYDAFGEPVPPTRFVPMKTPLGSEIIENWDHDEPPKDPLTLDILVDSQQSQGRKLGMILDLSNHETLYAADLTQHSLRYERVPLVAKILPTQQAINKVIAIADQFWSDHPEQYIAIHCAYGFNRTGFVLCSYLIQACHLSVQEALDNFASARPPGVRHEQFIEELHRRYDGWRRSQPIPYAESFSDLRGFKPQMLDSLHSEFGGVADHLTDAHPGVARGLSMTSSQVPSDVTGASPATPIRNGPLLKASLDHPHSMSAKSVDAPLSHCESVNNESLDLDERDIFRHFASRAAPRDGVAVRPPGHHRRARLSNLEHPAPVGEESDSSASVSPIRFSRSPFSTIQDSEDMLRVMQQQDSAVIPSDSGISVQTSTQPLSPPSQSGEEAPASCPRPPLYRGPVSARLTTRALGSSTEQEQGKQSLNSTKRELDKRLEHKPCTIM